MKDKIFNFIGSLVRDIIILFGEDIVEFTVDKDKYIYKSWFPISFSVGNYIFLPEKLFYNYFNM